VSAVALKPRIRAHRLRSGGDELPVYLLLPPEGAGALVVSLHDGPHERDGWGATSQDAWLLSRRYAILKVNFRGSSGFGQRWEKRTASDDAASEDLSSMLLGSEKSGTTEFHGFLDDVSVAIRWALSEQKVLGERFAQPGSKPPVAVLGDYFGGYAALHASTRLPEVACAVAVAPLQHTKDGTWWPESFIPDAEMHAAVSLLRRGQETSEKLPDPASEVLSPIAFAKELSRQNLLIVGFELDEADAKGKLLDSLVPSYSDPQDWPESSSYVEYASESRRMGFLNKCNSLDLYRRIDQFLHKSLSKAFEAVETIGKAPEPFLKREKYVDELAFKSVGLLPPQRGSLSEFAKMVEIGIDQLFKDKSGAEDVSLWNQHETPIRSGGFTGGMEKVRDRRHKNVAPASGIRVREDGTMEVTLSFREEPEGLHVFLTPVWMHFRTKDLGFTIALPRMPRPEKAIQVFKLGTGYVFEIAGEADVSAVDNFKHWLSSQETQGRQLRVLQQLTPQDVKKAPVLITQG